MEMPIIMARKVLGAKIMAELADGRAMILNHHFSHRDCASLVNTLARIRASGRINIKRWRIARHNEY